MKISNKMKLTVDTDKLNNLTNEIWKSAERLRGKFKAYEYQTVILPIIVIRRLECVLIQWRETQAAELRIKRPVNIHDKDQAVGLKRRVMRLCLSTW